MLSSSLASLVNANPYDDADTALRFFRTLLGNLSTDRAKFGSIKASAKSLQAKLTGLPNGTDALCALGFVLEGESYNFSASIDDATVALRGQHVTAAACNARSERCKGAYRMMVGRWPERRKT